MDNQQCPTVEHRELCSIFCNNLNGTEFEEEYSNWVEPEGYTKEELREEIVDVEKTLKKLDIEYRKQLLQLSALEDAAKDGIVYATVSGEVKSIENLEEYSEDSPFLVVMGDGDLYVKGVVIVT